MNLFPSVFQSVFKRRDVNILLAFTFLPLLVSSLAGIGDAQLNTDVTRSLLFFIVSALELQFQLVLPALIMGFIVSSVFRDEISSGILFLYKDIKKSSILHAKLLSLFAVYVIYFLGTVLIASLTYVVTIAPRYGFHWLPAHQAAYSLLYILTMIGLNLILLSLVAAVSIKRTTIMAVLAGVLFNLFAQVGPLLNGFRYAFPPTYATKLAGQFPFGLAFAISLGLILLYFGLAYRSARKNFEKIEY
ncbi:hypothetical protein [Streptococcus suis]|uniref:hypothetical protein n=1 Tax=Streptococcus suis TaxID=1307 RepID=UPI001C96CFD6|nr:hypothetical protein [Streptococcus suis]MBY4956101.1 hypothetical protein [Streptococcus suis]MBY4970968.1 hypothetical protein [Streptococcus suis]MBY4982013.1 hypothetical protein [Streptococcus suis]MBY4992758.1 hypothetical protein [Streptococcus suis]MBY5008165.1 hypothetical protein [Streptococcus suis]